MRQVRINSQLLGTRFLPGWFRDTKHHPRFTQHTGSLIEIRDFSPLLIRVEDGPSTSTNRKDLVLEIRKARLRGAAGEAVWGSPKPLDNVEDLKEWLRELRKPDGNQCALPMLCLELVGLTIHY